MPARQGGCSGAVREVVHKVPEEAPALWSDCINEQSHESRPAADNELHQHSGQSIEIGSIDIVVVDVAIFPVRHCVERE
jgi:hypothetical protein